MRSWRPRSKARALAVCGLFASVALRPVPVRAQAPRVHQLRYDVPVDVTVIGVSATFLVSTELLLGVKPASCRWCDRTGEVDTLNGLDHGVRGALRWNDTRVPAFGSNVVLLAVEPTAMLVELEVASAQENAKRAFPVDVLVISEAAAVSAFLNQAAKLTFARERPFVHAMTPDERERAHDADDNVSFYSGHTSLGFAIAVASGTVATLRGYRLMPLVWSTLLPLAATTGVLRMAADKHYFTDVLGGALVGGAVGVILPLLFHPRRGDDRVGDGASAATIAAPLRGASTPMVSLGGGF